MWNMLEASFFCHCIVVAELSLSIQNCSLLRYYYYFILMLVIALLLGFPVLVVYITCFHYHLFVLL